MYHMQIRLQMQLNDMGWVIMHGQHQPENVCDVISWGEFKYRSLFFSCLIAVSVEVIAGKTLVLSELIVLHQLI